MAQAPRPGVGARQQAAANAKVILRLTVQDKSLDLMPNNLSFEEHTRIRKQTGGIPFETYWNGEAAIGIDSVVVLWWLARRANGEQKLSLDETWREWQDLQLGPGDVNLEQIIVDDDEEIDTPES